MKLVSGIGESLCGVGAERGFYREMGRDTRYDLVVIGIMNLPLY